MKDSLDRPFRADLVARDAGYELDHKLDHEYHGRETGPSGIQPTQLRNDTISAPPFAGEVPSVDTHADADGVGESAADFFSRPFRSDEMALKLREKLAGISAPGADQASERPTVKVDDGADTDVAA